ncbi:MAG: cobalamin B12-binding domain-containing protein [Eubacteriaceae bacterium]
MLNLKELTQAVGELEEDKVLELLNGFIASNPTEEEGQKAVAACQDGMAIVGDLFEKGEYFVGDLIFAGELLTDAINLLKPVIGGGASTTVGTIVLGTVHGDLHDIGKNIFRSMSEAAGFEVVDIGIDQPVSAFVEKVKEVKPVIVGMSGVLTLALEAMKDTVDGLKEAGLRDSVKVIIGGNPVTKEACEHIGADAFTTNAAEGVKISQGWVAQ